MTIAGMLLVNNPGRWSAIYPPLAHATWHGWTPTDLIFPFFVFIVGITTQLSLAARRARGDDERAIVRQVLRRGALIVLFGLLLNGFPFYTWGAVDGIADPSLVDRVVDRLYRWRIPGVLQRIGIAYVLSALVATRASVRAQVATTAALLVGYWFVMTQLPVPGSSGTAGKHLLDLPASTMAAWTDRVFFDWTRFGLGNHLWSSSRTWDPEGVLSTAGAVATALLGNLAGRWLGSPRPLAERVSALFAAGALGAVAGLVWNWTFPINKGLWTGSYVLYTAGVACLAIATIMWLVEMRGWRGWTKPFVIYGLNPMFAFLASGVVARLTGSLIYVPWGGERLSLHAAVYQGVFAPWLSPVNASLAYAIAFVLLFFVIQTFLYRRSIVFKV